MKKENVVIKQSCHSQEFLLGIYDVLSNYVNKKKALCMKDKYAGDPRQNSSGMTTLLITAYGFTLIELLVVVLIIGILAAVAVPQYQRAVEKARITEAMIVLKSIADANRRYFLENGEYVPYSGLDKLDVTIPGVPGSFDVNRKQTKYFLYSATGSSGASIASAYRVNSAATYKAADAAYLLSIFKLQPNKIDCAVISKEKATSIQKKLCQEIHDRRTW